MKQNEHHRGRDFAIENVKMWCVRDENPVHFGYVMKKRSRFSHQI